MRPFTLDQLSQNLLILGPWGSAFKNKQVNRQTLSWTFLVCYQNSTPLVEEILRSCMRVLKFTAKYLVGKFEANFVLWFSSNRRCFFFVFFFKSGYPFIIFIFYAFFLFWFDLFYFLSPNCHKLGFHMLLLITYFTKVLEGFCLALYFALFLV